MTRGKPAVLVRQLVRWTEFIAVNRRHSWVVASVLDRVGARYHRAVTPAHAWSVLDHADDVMAALEADGHWIELCL